MDSTTLPDGLIPMIKIATRALVAACAVPGSTGPKRVEELTGASAGTISRWQGDAHPDIVPTAVVFLLEYTLHKPIFARVLAELTGHRLVAIGDDETAEADDGRALAGDLVRVVGTGARVGAVLGAALEDRRVTRREARDTLGVIGEHENRLAEVKRRLAHLADGRGA